MICGVPQGSILGPIHFSILYYENNIFLIYADDTALYICLSR